MIDLTLQEALRALGTAPEGLSLPSEASARPFPEVSIDSRTLQRGDCFFAIRGDRFDGHDFIEEARRKGASMIVSSRPVRVQEGAGGPIRVVVEDTRRALQRLAHHVRCKWGKPVVAITGSMGKTTTRTFTSTLLEERFCVAQSPKNWNNEIGVPLSLLALLPEHEVAVLELGMNHPGEIGRLASLCLPDQGVLTNVAPVHLEFFPSLQAIAAAKGELIEHLPAGGRLIYNADDDLVRELAEDFAGDTVSFGFSPAAQVRLLSFQIQSLQCMRCAIDLRGERLDVRVPFAGRHFLYNLAAAVAVAHTFGLRAADIGHGIERLRPLPMRGTVHEVPLGDGTSATLWDDSYNANPLAMQTVLETVGLLEGYRRKIVALGEMRELGEEAPALHRELGRQVAALPIDALITVGSLGRHISEAAAKSGFAGERKHFQDSEAAASFLNGLLQAGDLVVIKGSRGTEMERIAGKIQSRLREEKV